MDKEFLELKKNYINQVINDKNFNNKYAKSSAQNVLLKINKDYLPDKNIIINPNHLYMSAFYILYSVIDVIDDDKHNIDNYSDTLKSVASIFESLSSISSINYKFSNIDSGEALTLSSVAYNIAGYHANSFLLSKTALMKYKLKPLYQAINLFITKDFKVLSNFILKSKGLNSIVLKVFFNNILSYIHFGNSKKLETVEKLIDKYADFFFSTGRIDNWSILILLKPLIYRLEENSLWNNIPHSENIMWQEFVENLSFYKQPIIELWPSQVKAINDGLFTKNNYILKMPTSSGKTLIAEIAILESLICNEGMKCIYIAPFKSLAIEVREKLEKDIGSLGYRISVMYGEYDIDGFEEEIVDENDVLILTPEKLDLIIRENKSFAEQIALLIIDEGHIINNGSRGIRTEFLVNRIRHLSLNVRILFISAVFSEDDLDIMKNWLNNALVADSEWKPTKLHQGYFSWRKAGKSDERYGIVQFLDSKDKEITNSFYTKLFKNNTKNYKTNKYNIYPKLNMEKSASLSIYFQEIGQTIVFCARKNETEKVVKKILEALDKYYPNSNLNKIIDTDEELKSIKNYMLGYFDENDTMIKALEKGIAYHHADLPDEVKKVIEDAFNNGKLRILCCTTTLAQGVNLPAHNVIINSINHYRDKNTEINLTVKDYWNICGRAGRAFHSTEGNVIFVPDTKLFFNYKNPKNIEVSISSLSNLLLQTVKYNKEMQKSLSRRFDTKKIYKVYEQEYSESIDSLLSQLLALLCEEIINCDDKEQILKFFKETLFYYEISENDELLKKVIEDLFKYIKQINEEYDIKKLQLYNSTGIGIKSCENLDDEAKTLMKKIINEQIEYNDIITQIINFGLSIKETKPNYGDKIKLKQSIDISDVVIAWINYSSFEELKQYFIYKEDTYFYNFINRTIIQKLPWGIHSFLKILEKTFEDNGYNLDEYIPKYKYIASKVKYGVNDIPAIFICSLGIQNRNISKKIGENYTTKGLPNDYNVFKKWFSELLNEDIESLFDYSIDNYTLNRITDIRNRIKYNDNILILKKSGVKRISASVVGFFYENRYKQIVALEKGDNLYLKREYENKFDPSAVEVYTVTGKKVGYIERQYASYLSTYIDKGYKVECVISNIDYPNPPKQYGKIRVDVQLSRNIN